MCGVKKETLLVRWGHREIHCKRNFEQNLYLIELSDNTLQEQKVLYVTNPNDGIF